MSVIVETDYGRLQGTLDRGVTVFRGIPYARPPLGELRFQPPLRPESWSGVRDCATFAPGAPQNPPRLSAVYSARAPQQSEDCLTLNVWTPALDGMPRPVLLYVHGGGFVEGAASEPGICGRALARRGDVVVVTVQYRLGALGFLHLADVCRDEGLATPNLGLLDQLAAIGWVQQEIDAFGGDPSNVTLIGQGAGATSVACLLGSPLSRDLYRRAVLQSGRYRVARRSEAARTARAFLDALGLAPEDSVKLKHIPVSALLEAQQLMRTSGAPGFCPVVDGQMLPRTPVEALREGAARGVPLLIGSNLDETRVHELERAIPRSLALDDVARELQRELGSRSPEAVRQIVEVYRESRREHEPQALLSAIESDLEFRLPALRMAEAQSAHESRVFSYLFGWRSPAQGGRLGAFHGLELPFVFGTVRHHPLGRFAESEGDTDGQAKALSRCMRDSWVAFARNGQPSTAALASWPAYDSVRRSTLMLDESPHVVDAPFESERRVLEAQVP